MCGILGIFVNQKFEKKDFDKFEYLLKLSEILQDKKRAEQIRRINAQNKYAESIRRINTQNKCPQQIPTKNTVRIQEKEKHSGCDIHDQKDSRVRISNE